MRNHLLLSTTLGLCIGSGAAIAETPNSAGSTELTVPGLDEAAEILVDHWGIAHIYAESDRDALFLQGFNAARDRLWQIDLWRKRGLGLLAENFGTDYVAQDRAARMFLYRGDMKTEWEAYGPNGRGYAEAFVAGVNAYVEKVRSGEVPLPVEFSITQTEPDTWSPEDVVRIRSHGLTRNVSSEVARAQVACEEGVEADELRSKLTPSWTANVPDGLDPCTIPENVLADYELAIQQVKFDLESDGEEESGTPKDQAQEEASAAHLGFLQQQARDVDDIGSNNWTISPERTETGRPILANDPHRSHGVPSLRYVVHLNSPNMSVIGAGEPALPGISIGHNGTIAFGLTIFSVDQEDLYVYELNPDDLTQYRYDGGWEDMEVVTDTIDVRGADPQEVTMRYTRHGAVLKVDEEAGRAFALRTVWLEPGTSAYFGSADYMTARNWDEFSSAMSRFSTPSENQVYADTEGNIGWVVGAMTPTRDNWDGLLPVPGDGSHEWSFLPRDELPSVYNPEKGWFATANEMNLPEDFPYDDLHVGFEWADPSRYERISKVLSENDNVSLQDSMNLQLDDTSMLGLRLVRLVQNLDVEQGTDPDIAQALEMLKNWDGVVDTDSSAAVVAEMMLTQHLGQMTVEKVFDGRVAEVIGDGDITSILDLLEQPDGSLGDNPQAARDQLLMGALEASVAQAGEMLGEGPDTWKWGLVHKAYFENVVSPVASKRQAEQLNVGPLAMGGAGSTPRAARYNSDFEITAGASFRMVLDVGNWDASRVINSPGQSGDPFSAHYRDLAPLWAAGEYAPMVYSRDAVETNADEVIYLSPGE